MTGLPTDAQERKDIPLYSGLLAYFPAALAAVAELSRIGNEQHNPGQRLFWNREKSGDELDALIRHAMEAGYVDTTDNVRHSTKAAWRALANLQKELERDTGAPLPVGCYPVDLDEYTPDPEVSEELPDPTHMTTKEYLEWREQNASDAALRLEKARGSA